MKVVLDTNVILQIVIDESECNTVWKRLLLGEYTLCFSNEIIFEYEEILGKFYDKKFAEDIVDTLMLLPNAEKINVYYKWNLIEGDSDDNKFVDCAYAAGASYIVTEDKHFNILSKVEFPKMFTIKLNEFRNLLLEMQKEREKNIKNKETTQIRHRGI